MPQSSVKLSEAENYLLCSWCEETKIKTPNEHEKVALATGLVLFRQSRQWPCQNANGTIEPRRSHIHEWFEKRNSPFLQEKQQARALKTEAAVVEAPEDIVRPKRRKHITDVTAIPLTNERETFMNNVQEIIDLLRQGKQLPEPLLGLSDTVVESVTSIAARIYHHKGGNRTKGARVRFDPVLEYQMAEQYRLASGKTCTTQAKWQTLTNQINSAAMKQRKEMPTKDQEEETEVVLFGAVTVTSIEVEQLKRWWTQRSNEVRRMFFQHEDRLERIFHRACDPLYEEIVLTWWKLLVRDDKFFDTPARYSEGSHPHRVGLVLACNGDVQLACSIVQTIYKGQNNAQYYLEQIYLYFAQEYMAISNQYRATVLPPTNALEQYVCEHLLSDADLKLAQDGVARGDMTVMQRWMKKICEPIPGWYRAWNTLKSTGSCFTVELIDRIITQCILAELFGYLITMDEWRQFCAQYDQQLEPDVLKATYKIMGGAVFFNHRHRERIVLMLCMLLHQYREAFARCCAHLCEYSPKPAAVVQFCDAVKKHLDTVHHHK